MKKALITGAGGFIGSALVRALDEAGWEVHAVVRPGADLSRIRDHSDRVSIHDADVADAGSMAALVESVKPEHVFHLAASLAASGKALPLAALVQSNILGVASMLAAIEKTPVASAVFVGTCLEYGPKQEAIKETDRCEPIEDYGVTKLAGTLLAQAAGRTRRLPVTIFRLFTPYGPRSQEGRLVTETVHRALHNEPLALSRPTVSRDFIFIDDVIQLFIEAAGTIESHRGEIYNVGNGRPVTIKELAETVLVEATSTSSIEWGGAPQAIYDTDTWQADMSKTFAAFSWRPRHSLAEGIRKTIEAFQKEGH
jgi:nucleoside-diphosphate-sugar epimerase